jgi:hypothetical protein
MENETLDNTETGGNDLSANAKANLRASASWVKVIAILGFIGGGITGIGALFTLFGSFVAGIIGLAMAALYIFMSLLLMKQANAVSTDRVDMDSFSDSYLKYWKIIVILIIVSVVFGLISYFTVASQVSSLQNQFPM